MSIIVVWFFQLDFSQLNTCVHNFKKVSLSGSDFSRSILSNLKLFIRNFILLSLMLSLLPIVKRTQCFFLLIVSRTQCFAFTHCKRDQVLSLSTHCKRDQVLSHFTHCKRDQVLSLFTHCKRDQVLSLFTHCKQDAWFSHYWL